jgi:pilus assembly protein TadC
VSPLNWWEPNTSGLLDIGDLSAILFFLIGLVSAAVGFIRWWLRQLKKIVREEITEATIPIHPTANGGLSLPDVARRVEQVEKVLDQIKKENLETRDIILQVLVDKEIKVKKPRSTKSA